MNEKPITRRLPDPNRTLPDLSALRDMDDASIARAVAEDPDAAPLADAKWFDAARRVEPRNKVAVSLRVDADVLEFFKSKGGGYLTRMNGVLRAYMEHERERL
ncbi:MAG: BrnA antitoxin family protein [Niveispirillum sp.]|uniref:BrnA antitoxin family protein n=1 Tax=Niveispirillum sp. TaxID=1917217 RepID=UPI003BA5A84C